MIEPTTLSDAELIAAYHALDVDADDPVSEALVAEIEARGLDI